jgi:PPP family 3-phenylpropionic acid transporter
MSLIALHRLPALPGFIVLYAMIYSAFGAASPFWALFFQSRGMSAEEVGTLLGLGLLARLLAGPPGGYLADMLGARAMLAGCAALAACAAAGLLAAGGFLVLALVEMAHAALLAPITTLADALALHAARPRAKRGFEYGWVRGAASAAFILGTLAAGQMLRTTELSAAAWMQAVLLVGVVLAAGLVPPLSAPSQTQRGVSALAGARELFRIPLFRRLLVVAALIYGSHAMYDSFAVIRWNAAGMGPGTVSLLWSESVAAEVVVFLVVGPALINRIGPGGAAALAAAAGVVRWTVMAQTTATTALALVQPLHGLTFALLHLACMRLLAAAVPERSVPATAQALYAFAAGLSTALVMLVSGDLYEWLGAHAFLLMAILCIVALPLALRLRAPPCPQYRPRSAGSHCGTP